MEVVLGRGVAWKSVGIGGGASAPTAESDQSTWFEPSFPLDRTKLDPPPQPSGAVRRVGLLNRLRASSEAPVVAVVAPAGYGKSTLLSQWAEETPHRVAWLSLEHEDNDPAMLLASIAAALDRRQSNNADGSGVRVPSGASKAMSVARRVAAMLSSIVDPVVLLLDHTERLDEPQSRDAAIARDGLAPDGWWHPTAAALEGVSWLLDGEPDRADPVLAHAVEVALDIGAMPTAAAALADRAIVAIGRGDWDGAEAFAASGSSVLGLSSRRDDVTGTVRCVPYMA